MQARAHLVVLACTATVFAAGTRAAEWERGASLAVGSYFSDNICLVPENTESKAVGTVTPSVNVRGEGARAKLALQAAVEYNSLGNSSLECPQGGVGINLTNREAFVPRLGFTSELEALEDLVYLEANAFAAQNPLNPFAAGGGDNINARGNTNITYRWDVGARLERQFVDGWGVYLRYGYNEQYNSQNVFIGDSQEDRVDLDIGMNPDVRRFSLGVRGRYSEVTFDETVQRPEFTNRLSSIELRSALQLNRAWQLNAFAGVEDNVFLSSAEDIDGQYWDVGVRWTPHERVTAEAGYGERFFGDAPRFSLQYRHKRVEVSANYAKTLQFPRDIRAGDPAFNPDDPLTGGGSLPGDPQGSLGGPTFIGQSPVLNESFSLNYVFNARRTTFVLGATNSQQTQATNGANAEFSSAFASVSRTLGPNLSADLRATYTDNTGDGDFNVGLFAQDLESWRVSFGLNRKLARATTLTLRYQYIDQTSSNAFNNFEENRVDLSLRYDFRGSGG